MSVSFAGSLAAPAPATAQPACARGPWIHCGAPVDHGWRAAAPAERRRQRQQRAAAVPPAGEQQLLKVAAAPQQGGRAAPAAVTAAASAAACLLLAAGPALAFDVHAEPANALSLPTWAIHTSSVIEWVVAMGLMWRYGQVSGNPRWKGMAWGMLPCLGSAMCACTWHFFYNSPDLSFLVALQAALTVVGNCTCWWAAYRIYRGAQEQGA